MLWSTLPPLLLAWTHCNVQFFSAVLVSLRCFPFTAYWESMPQILGRSNHALLRLLYWAPFSLVNSAYSITCFCAKERIFWHFPGEIHVELTNSVPSPYPPPKKPNHKTNHPKMWRDAHSKTVCDGNDGFLPPAPVFKLFVQGEAERS